ncbi:MAG: hypothetical protein VYC17_05205 [Nitrospinota bacterium]|nr:hypothetical protein [Nitrospinota bacterium]
MMKYSSTPIPVLIREIFLLLILGIICSCVSGKSQIKAYQNLQTSIQAFNDAFEAKHLENAAAFVQRIARETFKEEYHHIKKNVTFDEMESMRIELFKNGVPVTQSGFGPEEDFNEALLTLRHRVVISPSNRVENITVKHRWLKESERWVVVPNLKPFSK